MAMQQACSDACCVPSPTLHFTGMLYHVSRTLVCPRVCMEATSRHPHLFDWPLHGYASTVRPTLGPGRNNLHTTR